jgi:DNA-binding HxlR family transcriptional regulator
MLIKGLGNTATLQILQFLMKNGRTKVADISIDASSSTLHRALNTLAELGLIQEEIVRPRIRYVELTPEGEGIAEAFREIDDILAAKKDRSKRQAQP